MTQSELARELAISVFRLNRMMIDYGQHLLELDGIKNVQITVGGVLVPLLEQEGLTLSDLARNLNMKAPTVTVIANRLEEKGLIRRERGTEDRRQVRLYLTESGKKFAEIFKKVSRKVYQKMGSGLGKDQLSHASEVLRTIYGNLEELPG
jgi:DNA-binding MarR family transcriptional regulator